MQKVKISYFIAQFPIWILLIISIASVFLSAAAITFFIKPTSRLLILHYSIPFGIDLVGNWYELYYIPAFGLLVFSLNFFLSYILYLEHKMISQIGVFVAAVIEVFLAAAVYMLVLQNKI